MEGIVLTATSDTTAGKIGGRITENTLYEAWKAAPLEQKPKLLDRLIPMLRRHARSVIWNVLHQENTHLSIELVDDLILDLASFEGRSKFSTWAHSRFFYRCVDEYRYQQKYLGDPLSGDSVLSIEPEMDRDLFLEKFQAALSPREREVIQARLEGHTFLEIAEQMGISRFQALRSWQRAVEGNYNDTS